MTIASHNPPSAATKPDATPLRRSSRLLRLRVYMRQAVLRGRSVSRTWLRSAQLPSLSHLVAGWDQIIARLFHFGGTTMGNQVTLYCDGDQCMEAIWEAISQARRQVWMEMYTLEPDRVGRRTLKELADAARRGCQVTLLVDGIGSSTLSEADLRPLRAAGAELAVFNPVRPWRWPGAMLMRDHRKIIIVDGAIAFCGGMNISDDYAGPKHGNGRFHDCHARMEGPCVRDLAAVFASTWKRVRKQRKTLPSRSEKAGSTVVQVQASRGAHGRRSIQRALRLTIRNAVSHCYITTPYFVPPRRLVRAIIKARERGVDVRILTAGLCDVPLVHLAAQAIYGQLLRHGVRIYEMFDSTLHAKTITIDGVYSTVGSFNLDTWSDKRNLEVNVAMIDPQIAATLADMFTQNIDRACEVTLDTWHKRRWWQRLIHWLAWQLLRL